MLVLLDIPAPHFRPDGNYAGGYVDPAARSARRRTVNALARSYGLRLVTDWPLPALGVDCYVLDVPATQRPDAVAERLSREPRVAWAQPMNVFRPQGQATHDDALFGLQPAAREWRLAQLHAAATGRGVRVAVVDSGVQRDHPDLAGQFVLNANFVADHPDAAELHGTAVAGIVAARADNRVGIVGVAPHAELLALRGCWQSAGGRHGLHQPEPGACAAQGDRARRAGHQPQPRRAAGSARPAPDRVRAGTWCGGRRGRRTGGSRAAGFRPASRTWSPSSTRGPRPRRP